MAHRFAWAAVVLEGLRVSKELLPLTRGSSTATFAETCVDIGETVASRLAKQPEWLDSSTCPSPCPACPKCPALPEPHCPVCPECQECAQPKVFESLGLQTVGAVIARGAFLLIPWGWGCVRRQRPTPREEEVRLPPRELLRVEDGSNSSKSEENVERRRGPKARGKGVLR